MSETTPTIQVITAGGAAKKSSTSSSRSKRSATSSRKSQSSSVASSSAISVASSEATPPTSDLLEIENDSSKIIKHETTPLESIPLDDDDEDTSSGEASSSSSSAPDDETTSTISQKSSSSSTPPRPPNTDDIQSLTDKSLTAASLSPAPPSHMHELMWLFICFMGIMVSFVAYGLLLEYTTSGGRKLHELSFLFVTSALYTTTAAAGRYVRDETPTSIPPARFAVLGIMSMGSTFCSVRSLRYVIFPIQVLAKSCKPVPVMIMGALLGKKYPLSKYFNVLAIVIGVGLFMGGGDQHSTKKTSDDGSPASQITGIILLFVSLCFDGATGAYEDKLMSVHSVGPFDLMYNIQLGKTILAGVSLLILNQVHVFLEMVNEMGFLLIALGLTGASGQVFIFVTIAKFGALKCSIIGLARKVTTLVASIYFYGHSLNMVQSGGLVMAVGAMIANFWKKKGSGGGHGHGGHGGGGEKKEVKEEKRDLLSGDNDEEEDAVDKTSGDVEMAQVTKPVLV